ncbi:MAG: Gfo/Idh/MocA family protein [Pseudomonadota bacterium]
MRRKIAIAGLGAAARAIHLPAYKKLAGLEVVGGFDPVARQADFSFPLFASVSEMLEKTTPHILAVVTPTPTHFDLAKAGLLAGCHVFCEKPFMTSLAEADEIISLSQRVKRWVAVNNEFRFMNAHAAAKRMIGGPDFGELLFIAMHQTFYVTEETEAGWRGADMQRTCKDFGPHVFDLCRYFFGEEPRAITARMPKGRHPQGPDYLNLIQLEFSGDRVAHIVLDRLSRGRHRYLDIRLDGSLGTIETSLGGRIALSAGLSGRRPFAHADISLGGRARLYQGEKFRKIAADPLDLFPHATARLLQAFLNALDEDRPPPCHGADNRKTLALMLAAYESSARNEPIALDL